jgi:transposase
MAIAPEIILVFISSLLTSLIPSLVILWRWSHGEARKVMAEANGERADATKTWREIATETVADLQKAREEIVRLESQVENLKYQNSILRRKRRPKETDDE